MKLKPKQLTPEYLAHELLAVIDNETSNIPTKDLIVTMVGDATFTVSLFYASGDRLMKQLIVTVTENT